MTEQPTIEAYMALEQRAKSLAERLEDALRTIEALTTDNPQHALSIKIAELNKVEQLYLRQGEVYEQLKQEHHRLLERAYPKPLPLEDAVNEEELIG